MLEASLVTQIVLVVLLSMIDDRGDGEGEAWMRGEDREVSEVEKVDGCVRGGSEQKAGVRIVVEAGRLVAERQGGSFGVGRERKQVEEDKRGGGCDQDLIVIYQKMSCLKLFDLETVALLCILIINYLPLF